MTQYKEVPNRKIQHYALLKWLPLVLLCFLFSAVSLAATNCGLPADVVCFTADELATESLWKRQDIKPEQLFGSIVFGRKEHMDLAQPLIRIARSYDYGSYFRLRPDTAVMNSPSISIYIPDSLSPVSEPYWWPISKDIMDELLMKEPSFLILSMFNGHPRLLFAARYAFLVKPLMDEVFTKVTLGHTTVLASGGSLAIEFTDTSLYSFSEAEIATVKEIADVAVSEIRTLLPMLPEVITLHVSAGTDVIPETGNNGHAVSPGHVAFIIDPSWPDGVTAVAKSMLRFTLFHELHHLARGWVENGSQLQITSLMDAVICDGLATAFERDFGGSRPLWGMYPDDVRSWVDELLALPVDAPYLHWMFGHPDGRRWIGYRAGTYIVDQAMTKSGLSAADLVLTPTDKVLELAGIK